MTPGSLMSNSYINEHMKDKEVISKSKLKRRVMMVNTIVDNSTANKNVPNKRAMVQN